ncbi:DUF4838 domain-containing protein [Niameybacter massiliensis]|uniref:DUF4838 domain-containing protein n=1 Tax=Niameybacter massiliensis TaxID=1658108 RepID=UPI0006B50BD2|nr:DUF4838 domain-containing protein [Niameybacter massiliensis]
MLISNETPLIVHDFFNEPTTQFAHQELTSYWSKIFANASSNVSSPLSINFSRNEHLPFDSYSLHILEDSITISSPLGRGILYGVYELLKLIGCTFIFPSPAHQYIPTLTTFELAPQTITKISSLEFRGLCLYQVSTHTLTESINMIDYMGKNNYNFLLTSINKDDEAVGDFQDIHWEDVGETLYPELIKRGIVIDMSEHSTDYFFPRKKWFLEHPEWFALINGSRHPLQICYSNADAVNEYIKSYCNFVKIHHDFKFIGIWPLDGGGYCECEQCKDPLTILKANKKITHAIGKVRPDLTVEHLAYTPQSLSCPNDDIPDNLSVLVCSIQDTLAYKWGLKAKNKGGAFYFDYDTGDHYRYRTHVWLNPIACKDMVNTFMHYHYRGIISLYLPITSWWQSSLNYYYLSIAYYNPCFDLEAETLKLSNMLFGILNGTILAEALLTTITKLQDKILWSRFPHKFSHQPEHICHRHTSCDALHLESYKQTYAHIQQLIKSVNLDLMTDAQRYQLELFKSYLELQKLFFECIDQFNFDTDSPDKVTPYFEMLEKLQNKYGKVFISPEYAKWRIIGRDNILDPKNTDTLF